MAFAEPQKNLSLAPVLAVGGVIIDRSAGEPRVVLVKRGKPPRAGFFSLPGGRVERGETLEQALRRELLEETGLIVRVGPLVEIVELIDEAHHFVVLDYLCEAESGALCAGDDADEAVLVALSALPAAGVTEAVLRVVSRAVEIVSIHHQS